MRYFIIFITMLIGQLNASTANWLNEQQSLAAVFSVGSDEGWNYDLTFINPRILVKIRFWLRSETFLNNLQGMHNFSHDTFKYRLFEALGRLGNSEDVRFIEKKINESKGFLSRHTKDVCYYFHALALMSKRNIPSAVDLFKRVLTAEYWKDKPLQFYNPASEKGTLPREYQNIAGAWYYYWFTGHPNVAERGQELIDKFPSNGTSKLQIYRDLLNLKEVVEVSKRISGAKKKSSFIKTYSKLDLKLLSERYANEVKALITKLELNNNSTNRPVILDKRRSRALMKIPGDKFLQTIYRPVELGFIDAHNIRNIERDLERFYDYIKSSLLKRKYELIENQILDNGKVIPSYKYKNNKEALSKELDTQRKIFVALEEVGYDKKGLQIRRNELFVKVENNSELEWKKVEEITVTFELKDNDGLYRKFFKRISPSAMRTMSDNKNFQIYFKRINGKWFWNPFGW